MKISITKDMKNKAYAFTSKTGVVLFWLAVWEVIYLVVKKEILIVSPLTTIERICSLAVTSYFWIASLSSLSRMMGGFLVGVILGVMVAAVCFFVPLIRTILSPVISVIKATPIASFIILALVWMKKGEIPVAMSALMVFPLVFGNVFEGFVNTDKRLLEMAKSFRVPKGRIFRHIYLNEIFPYFISGSKTGLGLAWKSGIAAEVISIPGNSIGQALYNSKIYLETADLFAWTVIIITLSILFEKFFVYLFEKVSLNVHIKPAEQIKRQLLASDMALEFENITKSFGANIVLDHLRVRLPKKGVVAITGISGSGKTTLMNILSGLILDDSMQKKAITDRIAVMFQEDRLLENATARENVLFVNPCADVERLFKLMHLDGCEELYPGELSGGMRRRVALARTMAYDVGVVMLDEPFKGLDDALKEEISGSVFGAFKEKLVILISHDIEDVEKFATDYISL